MRWVLEVFSHAKESNTVLGYGTSNQTQFFKQSCSTTTDFIFFFVHIHIFKIVFFTNFSGACSAAMRRIGSVSVRPTVYGWTGGGQVFASTSPRQEAENGNDDNENDDQTRDGNADGEIPLRKADHTRIIGSHFCGRFLIDESVIVEVAGLTNV